MQVTVGPASKLHGVEVFELRLPRGANVTLVVRGDEAFVPEDNTALRRGDQLLIVTTAEVRATGRESACMRSASTVVSPAGRCGRGRATLTLALPRPLAAALKVATAAISADATHSERMPGALGVWAAYRSSPARPYPRNRSAAVPWRNQCRRTPTPAPSATTASTRCSRSATTR